MTRSLFLILEECSNSVRRIAGIKEGLYSVEALAAYLLYRLNVINPAGESAVVFFVMFLLSSTFHFRDLSNVLTLTRLN